MFRSVAPLAAIAAATLQAPAQTTIIDFEDAVATLGDGSKLEGDPIETFYQDQGMTIRFDDTDGFISSAYLHAGVSVNDSADYRMEGTNGPSSFVIARNANVLTLSFDQAVNITLDIGASGAGVGESNPFEDFTVSTFRNNESIATDAESINVLPTDPDGEWITRSYEAVTTVRIRRQAGIGQFAILAVDNIRFEPVVTQAMADVADSALGGVVVASPGVGNIHRYIDGGAGGGLGERVLHPFGENLEFGPHLSTLSPATISAIRVRAINQGLNPRAINQIRLLADTDADGTFETEIVNRSITVPYESENLNDATGPSLDITLEFPPVTAQNWQVLLRNEFRTGAEILEIDLIGTLSPDPSSDLTRDGKTDVFDLINFLQKFSAALN